MQKLKNNINISGSCPDTSKRKKNVILTFILREKCICKYFIIYRIYDVDKRVWFLIYILCLYGFYKMMNYE